MKLVLLLTNISNYLENRYSLLCSNGTLALHLALLSIGIEKDDEVHLVINEQVCVEVKVALEIGIIISSNFLP